MIYLVVALSAEARPLVAHFGLASAREIESLEIYRRPGLSLIVSGVGRAAAAAAVEALARAVPVEEHSAWLNIGVAGHRNHAIGTAVLATTIVDDVTGERWTASTPSDLHFESGSVRTVDQVELEFDSESLYDMEAAAFYRQAIRLTTPDLVQVLKIVSDNRETGALCVSAHRVQGLVERNLPGIDRLLSYLHRQARKPAPGPESAPPR